MHRTRAGNRRGHGGAGDRAAPMLVVLLSVLDAAFATACVPAVAIVQVSVARSPSELAAASAMTSNTKSVFEVLGA